MANRPLLAAAVALSLCAACKLPQLESQWRDRDIAIDGSTAEWSGLLHYPEGSKIGIGIVNDDASLYLCLTSEDREMASRILRSGFSVLFESKGQKGKRFGVDFPLGMKLYGPPSGESRDDDDGEPDRAGMKARSEARMEASLRVLALLGPGENDTLPMATLMAESQGVAVRIKPSQERCVYELKVPLNQDSLFHYAIGVGKDTLIVVTLETNTTSRPFNGPRGGGFGGSSGGMGGDGGMGGPQEGDIGGGGMGRGGMGGHRDGGMGPSGNGPPSMLEPFTMKFIIHLAKK
jgi:hypothetical protein